MNIWSCLGAERIMQKFAESRQDCHGIVLVPLNFDTQAFIDSFYAYFDNHFGGLQVFSVDNEHTLLCRLREIIAAEHSFSMEELMTTYPVCGCFLVACINEKLSDENCKILQTQINNLCLTVKHIKDNHGDIAWSLLIVISAINNVDIKTEAFLKKYEFWGWFRPSDLESVIEKNIEKYLNNSADYQWINALCHGLARLDLSIVNMIADSMPKSIDDIVELLLNNYSLSLNDNSINGYINKLVKQENAIAELWSERPLDEMRDRCWRYGVFNQDCYGYPGIHPAALAHCKLRQTLEQVIVRGQIQVYLPQVLEVHQCLLRSVVKTTGQYGEDVSKDFTEECKHDIGPMYHYLNQNRIYSAQMRNVAKSWRNVRNKLAHNKFLSYTEAIDAYAALEEFRQEIESM